MISCEKDSSSYGIQGALRVRSVVLFQASHHRGHTALMELHGELGRPASLVLEQCTSYQSTNACVAINCIRCDRVDTGC